MQSFADPPRPQGMKEDMIRFIRFIGVIFIPQVVAVVTGIEKFRQFIPQYLDLIVRQDPDTANEPEFPVMLNLLGRQPDIRAGRIRKMAAKT